MENVKIDNITAFKANAQAYNEASADTASARKNLQNATWNILSDNLVQELEFLKSSIAKGATYENLKAVVSEVRLCFNNAENDIVVQGIENGQDFGTIAKALRSANKASTVKTDDTEKRALEAIAVTPAQLTKMPEAVRAFTLQLAKETLAASTIDEVKARVIADLETLKKHSPEAFAEVIAQYVTETRALKVA